MSPLLFMLCASLVKLAAVRCSWLTPYQVKYAHVLFEIFIKEYNKQYLDEEEKEARFEIFKENLERANIMNEQNEHAEFGITQFMDMTSNEFVKFFTCLGRESHFNWTYQGCTDVSDSQISYTDVPESHDWRLYNAVTRVKDQKNCGSCFAFSAIGNIEGQVALKHQRLIELSEQQIVDCDMQSNGCSGGFMTFAFRSILRMGGIATESSYPYVGRRQNCKFNPSIAEIKLTDCNSYNIQSQEKLKQLVYNVGPIAVAVKAEGFHLYKKGIMTDQHCNYGGINHAVLLVGYGTDNGMPYWLVKNSWAETFGEDGYIKIQRGEGLSSCGMLNKLMASAVVEC